MSVQQLANFANQFLNLNSVCICYKVFTADSFPNGNFKIHRFNNWTIQWSFPVTANSNPVFEIQYAVAPLCSPLIFFQAELSNCSCSLTVKPFKGPSQKLQTAVSVSTVCCSPCALPRGPRRRSRRSRCRFRGTGPRSVPGPRLSLDILTEHSLLLRR